MRIVWHRQTVGEYSMSFINYLCAPPPQTEHTMYESMEKPSDVNITAIDIKNLTWIVGRRSNP